jgi:phage RecT family recombinase
MANTAIATAQPTNPALQKFNSVAALLQSDKVQSAIARALPKHMTPERMIRVAMTALQKTPKLAECEPRSLVNALVQASELGLEPNTPLGEAYLIPYWNSKSKQTEAQLMPGYRGLIKLARQSEKVDGIYAELVYEKDFFSIEYGLNKDLKHRPALNEEDRGELIGAYAVAKFKDGYTDFEYMSAAEIEKIRKRSKSPDAGPWVTDKGEMWRKTPIRRLTKRLPLSVEDNAFRKAVEVDSNYDLDLGNVAPLELPQAEVITEEQRMALVDASKASGSDLTAIVHSFGFDLLAEITTDRYEEILAAVSVAPGEPLQQPDSTATAAAAETTGDAPAEDSQPSIDAAESKLADLKTAAIERFRELKGKQKTEAEGFLGTKAIGDLDAAQLTEFLEKFSG